MTWKSLKQGVSTCRVLAYSQMSSVYPELTHYCYGLLRSVYTCVTLTYTVVCNSP